MRHEGDVIEGVHSFKYVPLQLVSILGTGVLINGKQKTGTCRLRTMQRWRIRERLVYDAMHKHSTYLSELHEMKFLLDGEYC